MLGVVALAGNSQSGLNVGLDVPGIAEVSVGVIEPPAFAIGPVGTEAQSSQIRLQLKILNLPIALNLVSSTAKLTDISCATSPSEATFSVTPSIATACAYAEGGTFNESQLAACGAPTAASSSSQITIAANESDTIPATNNSILTSLLNSLEEGLRSNQCRGLLCGIGNLVGGLLGVVTNLLGDVLGLLDGLIGGLTNALRSLLGLELGNTEIYVESINCGVPTLVQ